MEIRITTRQILNVLLVLSWILFTGICIEAGSYIANAVFAIANPAVVNRLWQEVDLTNLFTFDHGHFFTLTTIMSIVTVLKAWVFFVIIRMLHHKNSPASQPFTGELRRFLFYLSYLSLMIGLFSFYGVKFTGWLRNQGVKMPDTQSLHLGGADVWLFMAIILVAIAQIVKRGIEIQKENELTV